MKLKELFMDENISLEQASEEVIELATSYAENYVDYAENLPFDLQHDVTRLREIDVHCREFLLEIENLYSSFTKEKDLNLKKRGILLQIQRLLARCQELGDEKISIVQQINEAIENKRKQVDHSCYRLKSAYRPDLKHEFGLKKDGQRHDNKGAKRTRRHRVTQHYGEKHEKVIRMESSPGEYKSSSYNGLPWKQSLHASLDGGNSLNDSSSNIGDDFGFVKKSERLDKKESSTPPPSFSLTSTSHSANSYVSSKTVTASKASTTLTKTTSSSTASVPSSNGSNRSSVKGKKKKKKVSRHHSERGIPRSPSPQPELPIDPDEPTYCLCDQVSFGQMIGCDNKKCPIEWFHFSCVGLSHKPKGKWYCPDCLRDIKDRRKDSKRDR